MADQVQQTQQTETWYPGGPALLEARDRGAALMSHMQEVMADTTRAVLACQAELLRLETEQAGKAMMPIALCDDPKAAAAAYLEQWHAGSEKMIGQLRAVSDLVRTCQWKLFQLCAESLERDKAA